jgi:hypothetical protein
MLGKRVISAPNPLAEIVGNATVGTGIYDVIYPEIALEDGLDQQRKPNTI